MAKTVIGFFDSLDAANNLVDELIDRKYRPGNISLLAGGVEDDYLRYTGDNLDEDMDADVDGTAEGAGVGAGIGAVLGGLGGLLVGLGVLVIPGIGPVLAAGPLAAALSGVVGAGLGAAAGGMAGGIIGALVDLGVPEERAGYYAEGIRRGGVLVAVSVPDAQESDQIRALMNEFGAVNIDERVERWRDQGWSGYDPDAARPMAAELDEDARSLDADLYDEEFDEYTDVFITHYRSQYMDSDYDYSYYLPAYQYGYTLGRREDYREMDWASVEPHARRGWERMHPDSWDEVKDSVRYAWEEVKER